MSFCGKVRLLVLFILFIIGQNFAFSSDPKTVDETPIEDWQFLEELKTEYDQLLNSRYTLFPHKGTYLLPFSYNSMANDSIYSGIKDSESEGLGDYYKKMEAEFQISFIVPVIRSFAYKEWDLLFAYTHHSWWQVYNSDWSRPFRESNYMPELFGRKLFFNRILNSNFRLTSLDIGYVHQSNGQTEVLSRSWDRIFARVTILYDYFLINLSTWYRLPEKASQDDNKDIYNYMGIGEVELTKSFGKHTLSYKTPILSHHFSSEVKYSYPWRDRLRWFARFQGGYGHSLIEYNRPVQRYSMGIILEEFFDMSR